LRGLLPATEEGVYFWMALLAIIHIAIATIVQISASDWATLERQILRRIFEGVVFSTSMILLVGLMDAQVLTALGDTKPFLFVAGLAGLVYSAFALRPGE
jgi:formate/nitrite transporter FocA (FNT family)